MMGGFPEYNFSVNARKTQANFAVGMRDPDEPIKVHGVRLVYVQYLPAPVSSYLDCDDLVWS